MFRLLHPNLADYVVDNMLTRPCVFHLAQGPGCLNGIHFGADALTICTVVLAVLFYYILFLLAGISDSAGVLQVVNAVTYLAGMLASIVTPNEPRFWR